MMPAMPCQETGNRPKPCTLTVLSRRLLCNPRTMPRPQCVEPRRERQVHRMTLEDLLEVRVPHPATRDNLF